jgi:hypothetical protein
MSHEFWCLIVHEDHHSQSCIRSSSDDNIFLGEVCLLLPPMLLRKRRSRGLRFELELPVTSACTAYASLLNSTHGRLLVFIRLEQLDKQFDQLSMSLLNIAKRALTRPISSSAFIAVGIALFLVLRGTLSDHPIQQPTITKKMHIQSIPMCKYTPSSLVRISCYNPRSHPQRRLVRARLHECTGQNTEHRTCLLNIN